ncbi:MAG: glycosyltransferase family 4 protein [Thermodesulfobacteriota bacterium]|nr:glycosyltransferase family 4 protein [Thermodesulfobacteriota bacterium]
MNILLITDSYPPEIRSASHLMQEMAEELRNRGHKVFVVTSHPQYNLTSELANRSFDEFSTENGINVIRVKTLPHHKVNLMIRGISQLTMPYIFFLKINKYIKERINVIIVYSPPLPLALVGNMVKSKYNAKLILNIQDIFPQNAIDLDMLKNPFLIKLFERMEKNAYKNTDKIAVHSEGNKKFLIQNKQVSPDKIFTIQNWIDIYPYVNGNNTNSFRKKFNLEKKFVFLFAGVIGPSQGLDLIIQAAHELREIPNICFLLVGDGIERDRLLKITEKNALKNVIFKSFTSKEEYPSLVKEANVGLVCLSSKNRTPVVPGKILGYMAASIPVVAFLNKESDGHKIVKDSKCGYSECSDDSRRAVELLFQVYNERDNLEQYGKNGFKYVSENFTKEICIDKLENLFL